MDRSTASSKRTVVFIVLASTLGFWGIHYLYSHNYKLFLLRVLILYFLIFPITIFSKSYFLFFFYLLIGPLESLLIIYNKYPHKLIQSITNSSVCLTPFAKRFLLSFIIITILFFSTVLFVPYPLGLELGE